MYLLESSKSGKTWKVILIEKGLSRNGMYYPGEVLKKAAGLFEKVRAFYYEWKGKTFDHLPPDIEKIRPEGFPRQIAGWYDNVKYETVSVEGKEVEGLTALLHIHDGVKWLQEMLKGAWQKGMKKILGLSINAEGPSLLKLVQGKPLRIVEKIDRVIGVDLVTYPAAGGQLVRLVASENLWERRNNMEWLKKLIELFKESKPELLEDVNEENFSEADANKILEGFLSSEIVAIEMEEAKKKGKEDDEEEKKKAKKKASDEVGRKVEGDELDTAVAEGVKASKEVEADEFTPLEEEAKGAATLKQVIGLLKAKKAPLALALLTKWLKGYPEKEAVKDKDKDKNKDAYKYPKGKKKKKDDEEPTEAEKRIEERLRQLDVKECKMLLDTLLEDSNLPEPVQNKIRKSFEKKVFKEAELKDSIKAERDVLAKLSESGEIINLGDDKFAELHLGTGRVEKLQAAMDLLVDPSLKTDEKLKESYEDVKEFKGLRDAYVQITGDAEVSGRIPRTRLREATTSDISVLTTDAINKRLAREYKKRPLLYKLIADVRPLKDFKTQHVARYGGIGILEEITAAAATESDSEAYPNIAFPVDQEATYEAATKGGIITLTRRMFINDDLRALQRIPDKLSRAAARALNRFVFDLMLNVSGGVINAGTYAPDGESAHLYADIHNNLGTDTLGFDGYSNRRTALFEQKEFGYERVLASELDTTDGLSLSFATAYGLNFKEGDYIQIESEIMGPVDSSAETAVTVIARGVWGTTAATHDAGKKAKVVTDDLDLSVGTLWVVSDGEAMAKMIRNSEYVVGRETREINPFKGEFEIQIVPRSVMRSTVNWVLTAKKADIEMMEIGFIGGKEMPEIFLQDAPGVGLVFTHDVIRYKIRHEYGGTVIDYRGFQAYIAS